jgi:hypothetical protein
MDASARTLTGNGGNRGFISLFSLFAPVQSGGLGQDAGFELVVPDEEIAVGAGYEVGFWHKLLGFSGLYVGLVGVSGPFAGANSDKSRAGGGSVGANSDKSRAGECLVGAHWSRVEANGPSVEVNAPVVRADGKPVGSHGRLEGTDGGIVLASGPRVGTREPNVGLA